MTPQTAQPEPVAPSAREGALTEKTEAVESAPATRPWNDAPLRSKSGLLIVLAAIGGLFLGMAGSGSGFTVWLTAIGLPILILSLVALSRKWACEPVERLAERLDRAVRSPRPTVPHDLPTERRDDVGQISRAIVKLAESAVRDYHQVKQLRRNLETRVATSTKAATRHLRRMAMRDPLTDLGNRRFLDETLEDLTKTCRSTGTDLVCAAIDMDRFKHVNDTLGHAAGDDLLTFTADLLRASIRRDDCPIRVGGDEFVVLMPGCSIQQAGQVFKQVLQLFEQHVRTALPPDVRPSLSVGLASLRRDDARGGTELMNRADENLYRAKRTGKGRVVGA